MEKLTIIQTKADFDVLFRYIKDKEFIAFDTETTGLDKESIIIGISICADISEAFYVVLSCWDVEMQSLKNLETTDFIVPFLQELTNKKLVMHNSVFDCSMVKWNYGIDLMPSVHTDTLILGHLLNENRSNGLKELGVALFGEDSRKEQAEMKESVHKNGGVLTKDNYEMYKADKELMAKYGAKDALLTLKIFYVLVEELYNQGLDKFFYKDESMPLLRGPTYDLNTTGLAVDKDKLVVLKNTLEAEMLEAKTYIDKEIKEHLVNDYPGTNKSNTFNIDSTRQLSWLLFYKLENPFNTLTKEGKLLCKHFGLRLPYSAAEKREFIAAVERNKNAIWDEGGFNFKTKKVSRPKKVNTSWTYLQCGKETLLKLSKKYKWVEKFLEYKKNGKILHTYVEGIESRMKYGVIRPSFLQHGTTSGRYSCRNPNFQNLPRDDKRVKGCITARPGNVLVGADYAQLEPRVFASFSGDERLLQCFKEGTDFYSTIGAEIFGKTGYSLKKEDNGSFAKTFPKLRDIAKVVALSATYGTTAFKMAPMIGKNTEEAQEVIDKYFINFPSVYKFMLESHKSAKKHGAVKNLYGRPRRMPGAKDIPEGIPHSELDYEYRNLLNLAVNHKVQSTAASIMNRAAIAVWLRIAEGALDSDRWKKVKIVLQVHDSLVIEGPEELADRMVSMLKYAMEQTVVLPGVDLVADPIVSKYLAEQK